MINLTVLDLATFVYFLVVYTIINFMFIRSASEVGMLSSFCIKDIHKTNYKQILPHIGHKALPRPVLRAL